MDKGPRGLFDFGGSDKSIMNDHILFDSIACTDFYSHEMGSNEKQWSNSIFHQGTVFK